MVDISRYLERNSKGLAEIVKAGGGFAIAFSKFNSETGVQENPEIVAIGLGELEEQKSLKLKEIANIDEVIQKIQSLMAQPE